MLKLDDFPILESCESRGAMSCDGVAGSVLSGSLRGWWHNLLPAAVAKHGPWRQPSFGLAECFG